MSDYQLNEKTFVIKNYNQKRPFASFLPGIAGPLGIPLWAFYVNRAQGISGFGVRDKNQPMMPFTPANKAYESVANTGFRTFIKNANVVYEPFKVTTPYPHQMSVQQASVTIEETNQAWQLSTKVTYFGLPQTSIPGLVRIVEFTNHSSQSLSLEILDGMAELLPVGIQNEVFKSLSNIMASWVSVEELQHQVGFFKLRSSTSDSSEVKPMNEGHFYLGMVDDHPVRPIVDPGLIFGYDTSKQEAVMFQQHTLEELQQRPQVTTNIIPSAFIPITKTLKPNGKVRLIAMIGYVKEFQSLMNLLPTLTSPSFWEEKTAQAQSVIDEITREVQTKSAKPLFDAYVEQCYLDNVLRGGYPVLMGDHIYHLYSRRHGDLERDYNFFSISPEYYSQGNGNFRDVCQNRRLDVSFHPEVKRHNIHQFLSLIQLDGYNPLSINGALFEIKDLDQLNVLMRGTPIPLSDMMPLLQQRFTPGQVMHQLQSLRPEMDEEVQRVFHSIMSNTNALPQASFGEGYWTDHFTYVLDLIENYVGIYPDHIEELLYQDDSYRYFESPVTVKPLKDKVTTRDVDFRQYHGLRHPDQDKITTLGLDPHGTNWVQYKGAVFQTNLYVKLFTLVVTKHSLLDRFDFGLEMEADKPGWNDAMNGLPGLFGSGVSETIELLRVIGFLITHHQSTEISVLGELIELFQELKDLPAYESRRRARERYRDNIRFGPKKAKQSIATDDILDYLERLYSHLLEQMKRLMEEHGGIIPTFLYAELHPSDDGVYTATPVFLPAFLEAPARLLKTLDQRDVLQTMHQAIQKTELFDPTLKQFKTSVSLSSASDEIGRIKAFTPGWLERESNFLHMTYKYVLGLLQAGLYEDYYEALSNNLVCFMDPAVYGRSPLENSSFIAPTNNPNPATHGQGFFARLSGSTVEALHMWYVMMTGGKPFLMIDDELVFRLTPKLHRDYFLSDGVLQFRLFHQIDITIRNKNRASTFEQWDVHSIELMHQEERIVISGGDVKGQDAERIRSGYYDKIVFRINE